MTKRRAPRIKKRLTCVLRYAGKRYAGLVLDLSANGLFVQTSAAPGSGEPLKLEVALPGLPEPLTLEGRAARRRVVPARLRAVAQGGVGIALVNPPEAYFSFVAQVFSEKEQGKGDEQAPVRPRRKTGTLERRARQLALRRALGRRTPRPASEQQAPPQEPPPETRPNGRGLYRVRVKLGLRKQSLEVEASSEDDARSRALARVGAGWRVLRCDPV